MVHFCLAKAVIRICFAVRTGALRVSVVTASWRPDQPVIVNTSVVLKHVHSIMLTALPEERPRKFAAKVTSSLIRTVSSSVAKRPAPRVPAVMNARLAPVCLDLALQSASLKTRSFKFWIEVKLQ